MDPFHEEFWEAACVKIETLERMNAWDVVSRSNKLGLQLPLFYHDLPCLPVIYQVEHGKW